MEKEKIQDLQTKLKKIIHEILDETKEGYKSSEVYRLFDLKNEQELIDAVLTNDIECDERDNVVYDSGFFAGMRYLAETFIEL